MDRLKYRVWNKERKCFFNDDEVVIYPNGEESFFNADYDFTECVVEQCTGLKDKNGKLIYEGDLIKEPSNKYPLEIYYDKGAWLTREYRKNGNNEQLLYALINCYGVEIIGNIHKNADMLGEE